MRLDQSGYCSLQGCYGAKHRGFWLGLERFLFQCVPLWVVDEVMSLNFPMCGYAPLHHDH